VIGEVPVPIPRSTGREATRDGYGGAAADRRPGSERVGSGTCRGLGSPVAATLVRMYYQVNRTVLRSRNVASDDHTSVHAGAVCPGGVAGTSAQGDVRTLRGTRSPTVSVLPSGSIGTAIHPLPIARTTACVRSELDSRWRIARM